MQQQMTTAATIPDEKFEKDDVFFIKMFFVYVNTKNEIDNVIEDFFELNDPNVLSTSEICAILEQNKTHNNITYTLGELIKYNFTADPADIIANTFEYPTLIPVNGIIDIQFSPTILFMQYLNCVYVIFNEKRPHSNIAKTRRRNFFKHPKLVGKLNGGAGTKKNVSFNLSETT